MTNQVEKMTTKLSPDEEKIIEKNDFYIRHHRQRVLDKRVGGLYSAEDAETLCLAYLIETVQNDCK